MSLVGLLGRGAEPPPPACQPLGRWWPWGPLPERGALWPAPALRAAGWPHSWALTWT